MFYMSTHAGGNASPHEPRDRGNDMVTWALLWNTTGHEHLTGRWFFDLLGVDTPSGAGMFCWCAILPQRCAFLDGRCQLWEM